MSFIIMYSYATVIDILHFFRAEKFSSNYGTLINIHLQHKKERPRRDNIYGFFSKKLLKISF